MVEAPAVDTWDEDAAVGTALNDFPDAQPSEEDEKRMATMMRYAFESRGSGMEGADEEDGRHHTHNSRTTGCQPTLVHSWFWLLLLLSILLLSPTVSNGLTRSRITLGQP